MELNRKNRGRKKVQEEILRLTIIALLSALGYVLMCFGKVQVYPLASFLELEISDAIVLVAYSMYGFVASFVVAILKTALNLLTFGPVGTPIPIGNIIAICGSLFYSIGLLVLDKVFHIFSKNRWFRYLGYVILIVFVSFMMTLINYLFATPTFLVYGAQFLTFVDVKNGLVEAGNQIGQTFTSMFNNSSYELGIFIIYFPFNLIKGTLVCLTYELIFNRVIFYVLKSGRFKNKIFMSRKEVKDEDKKESTTSVDSTKQD